MTYFRMTNLQSRMLVSFFSNATDMTFFNATKMTFFNATKMTFLMPLKWHFYTTMNDILKLLKWHFYKYKMSFLIIQNDVLNTALAHESPLIRISLIGSAS
jgi:hypothetical protein